VGIPIALKVIVTWFQTSEIQKNFMQYFPGKTALVCGLGEIQCILTENVLVFKRVVLLYVTKCLK
jgi:hypothetical protein